MRAMDIKANEIIEQNPDAGFTLLGFSRIMAVSVKTMIRGLRELSALIPSEELTALLTGIGFEVGIAHALTLGDQYAFDSGEEWLRAGSALRTINGYANEQLETVRLSKKRRKCFFRGRWQDSFESLAHRKYYGKSGRNIHSIAPVCFLLAGMTSGYASVVHGSQILVREIFCQAQGEKFCVFEGRPLEEWDKTVQDNFKQMVSAPFDIQLTRVRRHLEKSKQEIRANNPSSQPIQHPQPAPDRSGIIYHSRAMNDVLTLAEKAANTDATILLLGESGTGKEVVARHIHRCSSRCNAPFLAVNCAALPSALLESELFGHVRGAFTGAAADKPGLLVEAGSGTLFLDEVGDMPPDMQAKLLRVLQQKEVRPVGSLGEIQIKARILAATNQDLGQMVNEGRFRKDLYYRLAVVPITIAPLRSRVRDILPLARHFLRLHRRPTCKITPETSFILEHHLWPGNVRELENWIAYALIMAEDDPITPAHLPEPASLEPPARINKSGPALPDTPPILPRDSSAGTLPTYQEMGDRYIKHVLTLTHNNKKEAARILGIGTSTLWRRLKAFSS